MTIKVGEEKLFKKRDLSEIFPHEFSNRRLISKFINYVMNYFYEKSSEKSIAGYIGERTTGDDPSSIYITEPTASRQVAQLIPVVRTDFDSKEQIITYNNFISELKRSGAYTYDQNKLISNKYWSWCPPVDVDMFLNYGGYYWIGNSFDDSKEESSKRSYIKDAPIEPTEEELADTSVVYLPIVVLADDTNSVIDIIGKANYTYVGNVKRFLINSDDEDNESYSWTTTDESIDFVNGLRIRFENDQNVENNGISYIVAGVGEKIKLIEDTIELDDFGTPIFDYRTPDYFIIDRDSIDGNAWSKANRWIHREALLTMSPSSLKSFEKAQYPIMCFNKNIELYDYGTFDRGTVDVAVKASLKDYNGLSYTSTNIDGIPASNISKVLLMDNGGAERNCVYSLSNQNGTLVLHGVMNGQDTTGNTVYGDTVTVLKGSYANETLFFNGTDWKQAQKKSNINQSPLFNLYDADKMYLGDYENSEFVGSKMFDYLEDSSNALNSALTRKIVVSGTSSSNYMFNNLIQNEKIYYTPYRSDRTEITGYKFYKKIGEDVYLNDWHINDNSCQYIRTQLKVNTIDDITTVVINNIATTYFIKELAYQPSETTAFKNILIKKNGESIDSTKYTLDGKTITILSPEVGDVYDIKMYVKDITDELVDGYVYEAPLSIRLNQTNQNIDTLAFNNCLDHFMTIIENQNDITGSSNGYNNYYTIKHDVSLGNKIVQHYSPIIRSMVLQDMEQTKVESSINFVANEYDTFKTKFKNIASEMVATGSYNQKDYSEDITYADDVIVDIIDKINLGKDGFQPFYNNGVIKDLIENAYIPATPAYLGLSMVCKPKFDVYTNATTGDTVDVIICHDGSMQPRIGNDVDYFTLELENLIYASINSKFLRKKPAFDKYNYIPGRFRTTPYTLNQYKAINNVLLNRYFSINKIDYDDNSAFDYSSDNANAWKTWNYTGLTLENGDTAQGSYKALYMYYYDTYRPNTAPWEMLGFKEKPTKLDESGMVVDWWTEKYGAAPYTSSNINMWNDIENGIIADGDDAGEYEQLKRAGLVANYLPVDDKGELKSPFDIGLVQKPLLGTANKSWELGDWGPSEFNYYLTSRSLFDEQYVLYLLAPNAWVETNWNTITRTILFEGSDYEQVMDNTTDSREDLSIVTVHNEIDSDGNYIKNFGFQQWVSDYLTYKNMDIATYLGNRLRKADVSLGYRCAGFYQQDTISLISDAYDEIPSENFRLKVFENKGSNVYSYSGMIVEKSLKGYIIDGYDRANPYFIIKKPIVEGKKSEVEAGKKKVIYYNQWKDEYETVSYRTEFTSIQDVYTVINAYGKALEDMGWVFTSKTSEGEIVDFRKSSYTFLTWANTQDSTTVGNIVLLNPGAAGIALYHSGIVDDMHQLVDGYDSAVDIFNKPIKAEDIDVFRKDFLTEFAPLGNVFGLLKVTTYEVEHMLLVDNETIYGDELYEPLYANIVSRFKLYGVKVNNWYGSLYAPGYLVTDDGAIPNYEKRANDLNYVFDTGDVHSQGGMDKLAKYTVGYVEQKTHMDLMLNDTTAFDFYKGYIREKGTRNVLNKLNRSSYISSNGEDCEMYENWAFREGEIGHTVDNTTEEFIIDAEKIEANPQVITFETAYNNYYDESKTYASGDLVVYNGNEYKCKVTGSLGGTFDSSEWDLIRNVGNYVIYWDDEEWEKRANNRYSNCFTFTDNHKTYPTGGFAQIGDVDYIVATMADFEELKPSLADGQCVWVVKKDNDDWDIFKKTGEEKYVSMRYATLEDAYNKPSEVFVQEISDNKIKYYTDTTESTIELETNLYSDKDLETYACQWKDLGKPEHYGETGQYQNGYNYKVKLFNTVFTTTTEESVVNNNSPMLCSDGINYTYSNLLLNFANIDSKYVRYRSVITIQVDTEVDEVTININGQNFVRQTEEQTPDNVKTFAHRKAVVSIAAYTDDIITYEIKAKYCETITNASNPIIVTDLNTTVIEHLRYAEGAELLSYDYGITDVDALLRYEGTYELQLLGGGAGAGCGGTERHRVSHVHRKSRTYYYNGQGGGAGGYGLYKFKIDNTTNMKTAAVGGTYYLSCGAKGNGTSKQCTSGTSGSMSALYKGSTYYIVAQGGAAGKGYKCSSSLSENVVSVNSGVITFSGRRTTGTGGVVVSSSIFDANKISSTIKQGNNASGATGGKQLYTTTTKLGDAGDSSWNNGTDGYCGLLKLTFVSHKAAAPARSVTTSRSSQYIVTVTDSANYTEVTQKFINGDEPFYCYDVVKITDERPDANVITDDTVFYRCRSKSITATIRGTGANAFMINEFNTATTYEVGSTMMKAPDGTVDNYKYYTCINKVVGKDVNDSNIDQYFVETKPTFYYKIVGSNYFKWVNGSNAFYTRVLNPTAYTSETERGDYLFTKGTTTEGWVNMVKSTKTISSYSAALQQITVDGTVYTYDDTTGYNDIPSENRLSFQLYWDSECNEPVISTLINEDNPKGFAYIKNLILTYSIDTQGKVTRDYAVGEVYKLVEELGTYSDLKPIYIQEPDWSLITVSGSYRLASGGQKYYTLDSSDIITEDSVMYKDIDCETVAKQIGTDVSGSYDNLTYGDIIDTKTAHMETSYKFVDLDLELWTKEDPSQITDDAEMYEEETLENYLGTYIEYCPVWTDITFEPNRYYNVYSMPDKKLYKEVIDGATIRFDEVTETLYYKREGTDYRRFYPTDLRTVCTDNSDYYLIDFNYSGSLTGKLTLYRYVNGKYAAYAPGFKLYTKKSPTTYAYYVDSSYDASTIKPDVALEGSNSVETLRLFFNKQVKGSNVVLTHMIEDDNETAIIPFMNYDKTTDVMYDFLFVSQTTSVDHLIRVWEENNPTKKPYSVEWNTKLYELIEEKIDALDSTYFVDADDSFDKYYSYRKATDQEEPDPSYKEYFAESYINHTCKKYSMYSGLNEKCQYISFYQYGNMFYVFKDASGSGDFSSNDRIAHPIGTYAYITTYNKDTTVTDVTENEIVNVITYKSLDDLLYITNDSFYDRNANGEVEHGVSNYSAILSDDDFVANEEGTKSGTKDKGWMKVQYVNKDFQFNLKAIETRRIATSSIKTSYIVNDEDDLTLGVVSTYDPIQGLFPNDVLKDINYITSYDPVFDYVDVKNLWGEPRIGQLWWDLSQLRYLDYYQGDNEYRRTYWGKQLPGSEIVINEWTKSNIEPTDGREYMTKNEYNEKTKTSEVYYYYWEKNPVTIGTKGLRTRSALTISKIINNPYDEGIVWIAPIRAQTTGNQENSFIICNTESMIKGKTAVLQINMDYDSDVLDHTEWLLVNENSKDKVPGDIWAKMRDSLLGYKKVGDETLLVPDPTLVGANRYGISFRPRQSIFKDRYEALRNFVDIANDVFKSRTLTNLIDVKSDLVDEIDLPDPNDYVDTVASYAQLKEISDPDYVGKNVLVESDETHDDIWVIYTINSLTTYEVYKYQQYNINRYIEYKDWYRDSEVEARSPVATVSDRLHPGLKLKKGDLVKETSSLDGWKIFEYQGESSQVYYTEDDFETVALEGKIIQIKPSIYEWMDDEYTDDAYIDYSNADELLYGETYTNGAIVKVTSLGGYQCFRCNEESETVPETKPAQWQPNTSYVVKTAAGEPDMVSQGYIYYKCWQSHTSGETFSKVEKAYWKCSWDEINNITKYEYLNDETMYLIETIFNYFGNTEDEE